jgi:cell division protein FtsI (penicillin-binding protein 3)
MEKWLDNNGLADLHRAGLPPTACSAGGTVDRPARRKRAARRTVEGEGKYKAKAASGLVSNVTTGEIVALVSLPDFDPNNPKEAHDPSASTA